jgi:hypothetical protein
VEEERLFPSENDKVPSPYSPAIMAAREQGDMSPYYLWHRVVEEYTRRNLTFPSDKLIAISGIASWFETRVMGPRSELSSEAYLTGLWRQNLIVNLLWTSGRDWASETRHAAEYRSPSWSWASMEGPVEYRSYYLSFARREILAAVINNVRDGCLAICGRVMEATLRRPTARKIRNILKRRDEMISGWREATLVWPGDPTREHKVIADDRLVDTVTKALNNVLGPAAFRRALLPGTEIRLVRLFRGKEYDDLLEEERGDDFDIALVLKKSTRVPDTYERIGMVNVRSSWSWFDYTAVQMVRII